MRNNVCKIVTFLLILITSTCLYGQDFTDTVARFDIFTRLSEQAENGGKVNFSMDNRIKTTMESRFNKSTRTLKGWRIRVYRDNTQQGRVKSENVMASIQKNYPDTPVYLTYEVPNFYVSVGDFLNRESAEKMKRTLQINYPGASLIETIIKYPPL